MITLSLYALRSGVKYDFEPLIKGVTIISDTAIENIRHLSKNEPLYMLGEMRHQRPCLIQEKLFPSIFTHIAHN